MGEQPTNTPDPPAKPRRRYATGRKNGNWRGGRFAYAQDLAREEKREARAKAWIARQPKVDYAAECARLDAELRRRQAEDEG